jgi:hypothetical protein
LSSNKAYSFNDQNFLMLGGNTNSNGTEWVDCFNGRIDEIRMYNRALTAADIQEVYNFDGAAAPTGGGNTTAKATWTANAEPTLKGYKLFWQEKTGATTWGTAQSKEALGKATTTLTVDKLSDTAITRFYLIAVDSGGGESVSSDTVQFNPKATDVRNGGVIVLSLGTALPAIRKTNGAYTVEYSLPNPARTRIDLFDASGVRIRTVLNATQTAGTHSVACEGAGNGLLPAGNYLCRIHIEDSMTQIPFVVVR